MRLGTIYGSFRSSHLGTCTSYLAFVEDPNNMHPPSLENLVPVQVKEVFSFVHKHMHFLKDSTSETLSVSSDALQCSLVSDSRRRSTCLGNEKHVTVFDHRSCTFFLGILLWYHPPNWGLPNQNRSHHQNYLLASVIRQVDDGSILVFTGTWANMFVFLNLILCEDYDVWEQKLSVRTNTFARAYRTVQSIQFFGRDALEIGYCAPERCVYIMIAKSIASNHDDPEKNFVSKQKLFSRHCSLCHRF